MTVSFGYLTYPSFDITWDEHALPAILLRIKNADPSNANEGDVGRDYAVRNRLIWWALAIAAHNGYAAGVRFDPSEPNYPVVFIELPTGQVSWHMEEHPKEWDGHPTSVKYVRIDNFCAEQLKDLPKPPEDAMRYGESPYVLERLVDHPFETLKDRLSFRGEEV